MSSPTLFCTGPCKVNVGFSFERFGVESELGTCEESPKIDIPLQWTPLFSDHASRSVPYTYLYGGIGPAVIELDLNRVNFLQLGKVLYAKNGPSQDTYFESFTNTSGIDPRLSRGQLLDKNALSFQLSIEFTSVTRNSRNLSDFSPTLFNNNMPQGFYFPQCFVSDVYMANLGVDTFKAKILITATPYEILENTTSFGKIGDFLLFSTRKPVVVSLDNPLGI